MGRWWSITLAVTKHVNVFENPQSIDLNSKQKFKCHWWSSLWVKVETHNCIDGANDVPGYFYLNWDIFFKWNAFKTTVRSCSICPGFNVLWWHHAVDTPSTVWFNDWRVVVNSVTDLLTPSRAAYPEIFTHDSLLSILPISSAINAPTL